MLRSREEIMKKRKELMESAEYIKKKQKRLFTFSMFSRVILIAILIVSIYLLKKADESDSIKYCILFSFIFFCTFIIMVIALVLPRIFLRKWKSKRQSRLIIAKNLEEILELLEKPGGEKVFYKRLDLMIKLIHKYKETKLYQISASLNSASTFLADAVDFAPLQAYTWVASPGGVPGAKEE